MKSLLSKTIEFVDNSFGGKQKSHFERTVYWIEQFIKDPTEAHRIAAYSHDIERAFRDEEKKAPEDYLDKSFLENHQSKGAEIITKFLKENDADDETVNLVKKLVSKHEVGGDSEQNALMDSDSVSFFETNAEMFVKKKAPIEGYEKVKAKLDWMYNRISSPKAKDVARENYEKWSRTLDNNFKSI